MSEDYYESNRMLSEYLLFHYGKDEEQLKWNFGSKSSTQFPKRIAHHFSHFYPTSSSPDHPIRALELGCSVGRSSFELATFANKVIGLDFSDAFIRAANALKELGEIEYSYKVQGDIFKKSRATVPTEIDRNRVSFIQGDAMKVDELPYGLFEIVMASNLICRLPDPGVFLKKLDHVVAPNGVFILSTPYSYLEEFTDKDQWLGGRNDNLKAADAVNATLSDSFDLLESDDIPMLIREHERKFQWTICNVSIWKKR